VRELYLTFDDGPNRDATPRVLDQLLAEGVHAIFFVVGDFARRYPAIVVRAAREGHAIGNHTTSHLKLQWQGPDRIAAELEATHSIIADLTGQAPRFFRAPHGYRNPWVARTAARLGYRTLGWTVGVWDSDPIPAPEVRKRVRERIRPGAIILLHDGDGYDLHGNRLPTAEAVSGIIADARAAGYRFAEPGALLI
jgi:peptidoglycan/xylan/chitin deacetylase (PgdA/CDA1 family)